MLKFNLRPVLLKHTRGYKLKYGVGCGQNPAECSSKLCALSSRQDGKPGLATPLRLGLWSRGQPSSPAMKALTLAAHGLASRTRTGQWGSVLLPTSTAILSSRQTHPLTRAELGERGTDVISASVCACTTVCPCSPQSFSSEPSLQSFFPSHSGLPLLTQSPLLQR